MSFFLNENCMMKHTLRNIRGMNDMYIPEKKSLKKKFKKSKNQKIKKSKINKMDFKLTGLNIENIKQMNE